MDELATGCRRPDRTLLFDVAPELAQERGSDRREMPDRLDLEDLEFYARVREGFLERAARDPERFVVIRSDRAIEETSRSVREALADLVPTE